MGAGLWTNRWGWSNLHIRHSIRTKEVQGEGTGAGLWMNGWGWSNLHIRHSVCTEEVLDEGTGAGLWTNGWGWNNSHICHSIHAEGVLDEKHGCRSDGVPTGDGPPCSPGSTSRVMGEACRPQHRLLKGVGGRVLRSDGGAC